MANESTKQGRILVGAVAVAVLGAGVWVWSLSRDRTPPATPAPATRVAAPTTGATTPARPSANGPAPAPSAPLPAQTATAERQAVAVNMIRAVIDQHPEIPRRCYREAERRGAVPPGDLEVLLIVSPQGRVISGRMERGPTDDHMLASCIVGGLVPIELPAPGGDEGLRMTHSFRLPPP